MPDCTLLLNIDEQDNPNFTYLTNFDGSGVAIITKKKKILIVPHMETERARKRSTFTVVAWEKRLLDTIKEHLPKTLQQIGIDKAYLSVLRYEQLKKLKHKFVDVGDTLSQKRALKSKTEIALIKKACNLTSACFRSLYDHLPYLETEHDVALFLEETARRLGGSSAFPPIVASGRNASMPHHEPGKIKLKKGFLVIDYGVKYKGYVADLTRTIFLGTPTQQEISTYNSLLTIQKNACKALIPGKSCAIVAATVRKELKDKEKFFKHALGHGIGVAVHESPSLSKRSKDVIKKNMVVAVEPGIYVPGKYGIRIEDNVWVTEKAPKILSNFLSKNFKVIR